MGIKNSKRFGVARLFNFVYPILSNRTILLRCLSNLEVLLILNKTNNNVKNHFVY
jgi:hypothetical protein